MCRRLMYLVSLIFVLSLAANASADLILHWRFDDGSGTTAVDTSGNGHNGTLEGDPKWVAGKIGGALDFGGDGDRVVDAAGGDYLNGLQAMTVTVWIKSNLIGTDKGFIEGEDPDENDNVCTIRYDSAGVTYGGTNVLKMAVTSSSEQQLESSSNLQTTEWQHVAMTWSSGDIIRLYIDGVEDTPSGNATAASGPQSGVVKFIVGQGGKDSGGGWDGLIDDVRIYDEVLSAERIQGIMLGEGYPYAIGPSPDNGAMYPDTWASLSWTPGDFAVSHDIYIGENFDDVNNGAGDTFRGNQDSTFYIIGFPGYPYPDGLVPGTTYYWRIDEVNEAEPNSPWKGNVWSFSIPPKTAYYPVPSDGAEFVDLNVKLQWTAGFGTKVHYIVLGEDFDQVSSAAAGIPSGTTTYTPSPLELAKTYYWRVDEFDGAGTYKGEVWSFTTLGAVSGPNPADGAVDVKPSVVLTWDAGAVADSHEVYFGTDADAVKNATTTSPEYKGPKTLGEESYDPGTLMLNTAYYWRIDEVNGASTDSPWAGNVWSFSTGDFFVIDDFEHYDANDNQIWYAWHDGLGYGAPGTPDFFGGNGTGAAVGDETTTSYTEETIINGGLQSMPVAYDNNKQGYSKYSEVELTLTDQRDWTAEGVAELSLWFRGNPASTGSFVEGPVGTYTMTASGADIWAVNSVEADEFHFAYKMLTGAGSIVAKVESVENTNAWAKAGVMIRESLSPGSAHAMMVVTPGSGVSFQRRPGTSATSLDTTTSGIVAPYWVKIERSISGSFTAYHSANGTTWTMQGTESIPMGSNVYIGLAVTAHNAAATCEAVFSNVTTTGSAGAQWANQDIGIASNDPEPLYVAVSNSTGNPVVVVHDDPAAAQIDTWTEWVIPLQAFADQGIILTNVDRIAIGLGTRGNMTVPGGSGKMYIDDIRLYQPSEAAE